MIDQCKVDLASRVISSYVELVNKHDLLPSEYIVYHALIFYAISAMKRCFQYKLLWSRMLLACLLLVVK